jgi:hypothetical protein
MSLVTSPSPEGRHKTIYLIGAASSPNETRSVEDEIDAMLRAWRWT